MIAGVVAMVLIGGLVLLVALNRHGQPHRRAAGAGNSVGDSSVGWSGGSGSDCDSGSDAGCDGGGDGGGGGGGGD
jgi:hypothetical protein